MLHSRGSNEKPQRMGSYNYGQKHKKKELDFFPQLTFHWFPDSDKGLENKILEEMSLEHYKYKTL